ncbi:hypothetical protein AB1Y20_023558 [Prymnesium parvum]|uniref:Uncharacterized protein n=1 Tax=Prymnesium parvum TaxID=97485 RepID=A0AB34JF37_PRYPA
MAPSPHGPFWTDLCESARLHAPPSCAALPPLQQPLRLALCLVGCLRTLPASPPLLRTHLQLAHRLAPPASGGAAHFFVVGGSDSRDCEASSGQAARGCTPLVYSYGAPALRRLRETLRPRGWDVRAAWPPARRRDVCAPQFDKLARCLRLVEAEEARGGARYDFVVRLRTDVAVAAASVPPPGALRRAVYASFKNGSAALGGGCGWERRRLCGDCSLAARDPYGMYDLQPIIAHRNFSEGLLRWPLEVLRRKWGAPRELQQAAVVGSCEAVATAALRKVNAVVCENPVRAARVGKCTTARQAQSSARPAGSGRPGSSK